MKGKDSISTLCKLIDKELGNVPSESIVEQLNKYNFEVKVFYESEFKKLFDLYPDYSDISNELIVKIPGMFFCNYASCINYLNKEHDFFNTSIAFYLIGLFILADNNKFTDNDAGYTVAYHSLSAWILTLKDSNLIESLSEFVDFLDKQHSDYISVEFILFANIVKMKADQKCRLFSISKNGNCQVFELIEELENFNIEFKQVSSYVTQYEQEILDNAHKLEKIIHQSYNFNE